MSYNIKYIRPTRAELRKREADRKEHNKLVDDIDKLTRSISKEEMTTLCPQCVYGEFPVIKNDEVIDVWRLVDIQLPLVELKAFLKKLQNKLQETKEPVVA